MTYTLVDPALVREVTSRSFVLLQNQNGLLPLKSDDVAARCADRPECRRSRRRREAGVSASCPSSARDLSIRLRSLGEFDEVDVQQGA